MSCGRWLDGGEMAGEVVHVDSHNRPYLMKYISSLLEHRAAYMFGNT